MYDQQQLDYPCWVNSLWSVTNKPTLHAATVKTRRLLIECFLWIHLNSKSISGLLYSDLKTSFLITFGKLFQMKQIDMLSSELSHFVTFSNQGQTSLALQDSSGLGGFLCEAGWYPAATTAHTACVNSTSYTICIRWHHFFWMIVERFFNILALNIFQSKPN